MTAILMGARESRTLTEVRSTLLPKLLSGEIGVPETTGPEQAINSAAEQLAGTKT